MSRPRPLRWVMLVPTLLTVVIGFAMLAVYIDRVEQTNRIADVDQELARAERGGLPPQGDAAVAGSADQSPPDQGVDPPTQLVLDQQAAVVRSGGQGNPFTEGQLSAFVGRDDVLTLDQPRLRVRLSSVQSGETVVTALSLEAVDNAIAAFRLALASGAAAIMLLVAAVVWWVTGRVTEPVTTMATTARRIADGELEVSITGDKGSREIADLSQDLRRMLARLRQTIDEREQAASEAVAARDQMRRLLADMSHELRTPLTALKGYSELYQGGMLASTAEVDRAMSRVGSESDRLHRLASEMLQLAGSHPETRAVEPGAVDLTAVVRSVVADLRAAHPQRTVHSALTGSSAAPDPVIVRGVLDRLHQAVLNLGANACQHSPDDAAIQITLSRTDGTARVSVIDHGPGVSAEDGEQIFLPFYRAESSRSREAGGGAGLGLALARQIAEGHGGRVELCETPGGGATFVLELPLSSAQGSV